MIDSYGKPERGFLQGNLNWLGDYNECIDVYAPPFNNSVGDFHGQYCTLSAKANIGNQVISILHNIFLLFFFSVILYVSNYYALL